MRSRPDPAARPGSPHDGTDFNADVVRWNVERMIDPATGSIRRSELGNVKSVDVLDSHTVRVNLKEPDAALLATLTDRAGVMVSRAAVEKHGKDFARNPVGTGPFQFAEWVKDDLGRDILSRILYGARVSLLVGVASVGISLLAGVSLGLVAGYRGGWVDEAVMRVMDGLLAFPALVLALAITAALGPSLRNAMIAIGIVGVPGFARLVRGQALSLRAQEYYQLSYVGPDLGGYHSPRRILSPWRGVPCPHRGGAHSGSMSVPRCLRLPGCAGQNSKVAAEWLARRAHPHRWL